MRLNKLTPNLFLTNGANNSRADVQISKIPVSTCSADINTGNYKQTQGIIVFK